MARIWFGKDKAVDILYDIHIRRVFLRTGLVDKDNKEDIIAVARKLNPEYPAALDLLTWKIGKKFYHQTDPECPQCPLRGPCPKEHP